MACPSCDHTMQGLGHGAMWCPRCGTTKTEAGTFYTPALVSRCRSFAESLFGLGASHWARHEWKKLGIAESINLSANRQE